MKIYTIKDLLVMLPSFSEHTNENTVYLARGKDYRGNDYSVELLQGGGVEVRHTGATNIFPTLTEAVKYMGVR